MSVWTELKISRKKKSLLLCFRLQMEMGFARCTSDDKLAF